jgi:hypothetical protein
MKGHPAIICPRYIYIAHRLDSNFHEYLHCLNRHCLKSLRHYFIIYIWVNYNDLTATSLEIIVNKGNHPQMAEQFTLVNYYN